jgi:citrate synthase
VTEDEKSRVFEGLEGVLVARTELSAVEGDLGRLSIRGRLIDTLVGDCTFEDMVGLLLDGALPDDSRRAVLRAELGRGRQQAHARLSPLVRLLPRAEAMSGLLTGLSLLPAHSTVPEVLGMAAVASAAFVRTAAGPLVPPSQDLSHAADFLRLAHARVPTAAETDLLDAYWVTVAEHGFNASTFAARVTASTGADLPVAVVAGVAALSGPLHGGAPGPVLDMLDAVGSPENAEAFVRSQLSAGKRIMGMGHRVYRVRDPRAFVLERALTRFQGRGEGGDRLRLARAVEAAAEAQLRAKYPERGLRANVEFYTALLLEALAVPRAAFTALFACARVAGYSAHYAEQRARGRLIRPSALYVGPAVAV